MNVRNEQYQVIQELQKLPTAWISDGMSRIGLHGGWLSGIAPRSNLKLGCYVGPVLTVQWAPVQNRDRRKYTLYEIIRERKEESILLIAGGNSNCYLLGDNVSTAAKTAGFDAILVDGSVRDSKGLKEVGIGVFSVDISGGHPNNLEIVAYKVPLMFRGEWIQPGDIVAADQDGAVVFPSNLAADILYHAKRIGELEKEQRQTILQQEPIQKLFSILKIKSDPEFDK